jgi:hypothetical protein
VNAVKAVIAVNAVRARNANLCDEGFFAMSSNRESSVKSEGVKGLSPGACRIYREAV